MAMQVDATATRCATEADLPPPPFYVDEQVGFLLRRAHHRHSALFQGGIGEAALTPTQFVALMKVVEQGSVTQNLLGRQAAMDPATTQGVIRRLLARGLLERRCDPADRRTAVLAPTASGRDVAARAVACACRITEATLAPLDADERRSFLSLLRRLV